MHIALVNRWYQPYGGGGISAYNYFLGQALSKLGHKVTVIASRASLNIPEKHKDGGVIVYRIFSRELRFLKRLPVIGRYSRFVRNLIYSINAARLLRRLEKLDVVEFADVEAEGFWYLLFKKRARVLVRCHAPIFILRKHYSRKEMPYDTALISAVEKYCIRHADSLSAPSRSMASVVAEECSLPEGRITVIPNGFECGLFGENHGKKQQQKNPTVIYLGRFEPFKGIEILAEAALKILNDNPQVRFIFAGEDRPDQKGSTWKKRLEEYFQEQRLAGNVLMPGYVDPENLMEWYQKADIAVVPSLVYESFSYTCAQAMAAGLPVVASRIGGIPETVEDGVSGILVEPGDARQLADALLELLRNPEKRLKMGKAGIEKAKQFFDIEKTAAQFLRHVETDSAGKK